MQAGCIVTERTARTELTHERLLVDDSSAGRMRHLAARHEHLVAFYETEAFLTDTVCGFLAPALRDGDAAIVVATADHRRAFDATLRLDGIDVDAAMSDGRYFASDARAQLNGFMVEGRPVDSSFRDTIGAVLDRASEGGHRVHVYGEMVALLWDDGNVDAAMALEDMWNDLGVVRPFELLCAYPMTSFADAASAPGFAHICSQHTTVIPSEGYSLLTDASDRMKEVARLQQHAAALDTSVLVSHASQEAGQGQKDGTNRQERDHAGDLRDRVGNERDEAAAARDEAAEERDRDAERCEVAANAATPRGPLDHRVAARRDAADDRRRALQDRRAAASERSHAELDRDSALADRGASARAREIASRDDLTGAYRRGPGLAELERETGDAQRKQRPLIVAYVDVDRLKAINDSRGHAAGDRMLLDVATTLRSHLRLQDVVIRYGGDEFVCVLPDANLDDATGWFDLVNAALTAGPFRGSVTVGLAEMRGGESADDFVARADAALYRKRQLQRCAAGRRLEPSPAALAHRPETGGVEWSGAGEGKP